LDWGKELQLGVCGYIITHTASCADWVCINVESQTLFKFISAVEQGYPPNPFHNFSHGVDVLYSVARFLQLIGAGGFLSEVTLYTLLIAALAHDVGHLGVNNQFLMETSHELAIKYNDRSPMEMMHCSKLFHIVRDPSCDIFNKIDKNQYKEMRKHIIDGILHTDMTQHAPMVKDLGLLYQMNSDSFDRLNPGSVVSDDSPHTVQTVMNALLHCADISNPMKPWELCQRYADMVLDEFFAQGDKERELGVPVQFLNDRAKVNRPNSQVGFIEFVIAPMCEVCVQLFPQLGGLADNLGQNIKKWSDMWQAESSPEQAEIDKVNARVQKVVLRCKATTANSPRAPSAIAELP
jgi:thiol-disulfide isomerase/thioredoxin